MKIAKSRLERLEKTALDCRRTVLKMVYWAQSCHIGSCLSSTELATAIDDIAKVDKSLKPDRDRVVYSKGWVAAVSYYFLAKKGIIPEKALEDFYLPESPYIGLVERKVCGIEFIGSAMGAGIVGGTGYAFAGKKIKKDGSRAFVLMSDGEMAIGTTYECALIAAHHKLDNLKIVCDYNKLCAMGRTNDVLGIEPLAETWRAFGWEVREVDGHDFNQILPALETPHKDKPLMIIAHTVKGKGVEEFEDKLEWHYKNVDEKTYLESLKNLYA